MNKFLKTSILITISILWGLQINAQNGKNIYLKQSERIEKLNVSGKFIGLYLSDSSNNDNFGVLYDTTGNKLFEYRAETGRIKNILPNEKNNQVIIINKHWNTYEIEMDEIISYDITDKSVKWKTRTKGIYYKKSPDSRYLLVSHHNDNSDVAYESKLDIIDLNNGEFLPLSKNYIYFVAEWYDSSRIIINTWGFEFVNNEGFVDNYAKYVEVLDSIRSIRAKLNSDLKNGILSKEDYEKALLQLNNDHEKIIITRRKQLIKHGGPYTARGSDYKLIRYNIHTNNIEMERIIERGEEIPTIATQIFVGKYSGENNNFIYVKETKNRLTKLDRNFNLIWATDFESSLYEIVENDEIYFVTYDKKNDIYKLITKNGQKRTLSNNDEIVVNIKKNELPDSNIIDLRRNVSIDMANKRIKLSKE